MFWTRTTLALLLVAGLGVGCDSRPTCAADPIRCVDSTTCAFRQVVSGCETCPTGSVPASECASADAGRQDASEPDASSSDAGPIDGGPQDGGATDSGPDDAGPADSGAADAGAEDARAEDAGSAPAECSSFCTPTCFRPYNCVRVCGGPVTACGCCTCAEGSIDDISCSSDS